MYDSSSLGSSHVTCGGRGEGGGGEGGGERRREGGREQD